MRIVSLGSWVLLGLVTTLVLQNTQDAQAAETEFSINAKNTKITFLGTKKDGKHEGGFNQLKGQAKIDPTDLTTLKLSVDIDMNSTFSDDNRLTNHLKSPDFFSVKAHPKSSFVVTKVEKAASGVHLTGKLTMLGKTGEVKFPATIKAAKDELILNASFAINREDWGMSYGKGKIDNEVRLTVKLAIKAE